MIYFLTLQWYVIKERGFPLVARVKCKISLEKKETILVMIIIRF